MVVRNNEQTINNFSVDFIILQKVFFLKNELPDFKNNFVHYYVRSLDLSNIEIDEDFGKNLKPPQNKNN